MFSIGQFYDFDIYDSMTKVMSKKGRFSRSKKNALISMVRLVAIQKIHHDLTKYIGFFMMNPMPGIRYHL